MTIAATSMAPLKAQDIILMHWIADAAKREL